MSGLSCAAAALLAMACPPRAAAQASGFTSEQLEEAQAFVERHPDFGKSFTRAWEKVLGELDSLREHRDFVVRRRQVGLVIADTGHGIRDQEAASYILGSVYLNRTYLAVQAVQLGRAGMPPEQAAEVLALKMMPVLAHEIRHGMNEEAMKRTLGYTCSTGILEEEETAFYDNACVTRDAVRLRPELWADALLLDIDAQNGIILSRWKEGPASMAELVRERYPGKTSVLSGARAKFAAELGSDAEALAKVVRDSPRYRKIVETSEDPEERERAQAYLDSAPSAEEAKQMLAQGEACRKAMLRPEAYEALREFYRRRLAAARRLCRP